MARSGWREVGFTGGRLDGRARMVKVGPQGQLAEEIRIEVQAGQHEVYELRADEVVSTGITWSYRNPLYVLQQ